MSVSQRKIADMLGIAPSTVSRALRAEGNISPETRRMIQEAAMELGYSLPNAPRRTPLEHVLVVFLSKWSAEFFGAAVLGMSAFGGEHGIRITAPGRGEHLSPENLLSALTGTETCQAVIIGLGSGDKLPVAELKQIEAAGVTVVLLNRHEGCHLSAVTIDDYAAGETAARHLYSLGHRRLACVSWPDNYVCFHKRVAGFQNGCRALGIYDPSLFVILNDFKGPLYTDGESRLDHLFTRPDPPTAIFTVSDMVAHEVINIARRHGRDVPDDLAVIGFDNTEMAEHLGLPTFDFRRFELCRQAIKLAKELYDGEVEPPVHITLPPTLVCRNTTKRRPSS